MVTLQPITVCDLDTLCVNLFNQRNLVDGIKEELKKASEKLQELEAQVMAYLEQHDKKRYSVGGVGSITVAEKLSYKIPRTPENREAFFKYLKDRGVYEDLISVNSQTLNAFCRAELEAAVSRGDFDAKIPGIEEPVIFKQVQIRREK